MTAPAGWPSTSVQVQRHEDTLLARAHLDDASVRLAAKALLSRCIRLSI